ncbi:MAG: 50S ribosomal protein L25 [Candidatus Omnitrophica bacterium]|nr:50S ribosomal protein L25 [Candidatus Omnitrophota bacterium]MCM8832891.1 50S ribosomal protein L25 [Candidatus Omnitrophota bacterium]
MEKIVFIAEVREGKGKGFARKLRSKGYIPGILYGPDIDPIPLKLEKKTNEKIIFHLTSHNIIAEMKLKKNGDEQTIQVVLKDIQTDPIKDEIIHLDFYKLSSERPVILEIPVVIKGKSIGEEKGGILEQELREIKLEGLPGNIPEKIEIDIKNLDFGHAILVKDIKVPDGVKILEDEKKVVVTVLRPKEGIAEEVKVEEIQEEPKVISQEKVEERRKEKEQAEKKES